MPTSNYTKYHGDGRISTDIRLPKIDLKVMTDPEGYRAGRGLVAAVNAALRLGMPLLLTGEPGTGKTQLAYSLAHELNLGKPLRYVVKSDTRGKDLLYEFDTVGRFHAANTAKAGGTSKDIDPRRYLNFNALGQAILSSYTRTALAPILGPALDNLELPESPRKSVVLIDEIDKAPRDVPNDLLAELDELTFTIPEIATQTNKTGTEFSIQSSDKSDLRPLIIITSNSERALPDPFLRRCLYYHLPFPSFDENKNKLENETTLQTIVASRMGFRFKDNRALITQAMAFFRFLREQNLERKPGLAELLNWLAYLVPKNTTLSEQSLVDLPEQDLLDGIRVALLKNPTDQGEAETLYRSWLDSLAQV